MNAQNSFEEDFFKLMNNIVFGKTMENLRKRVDVRLVTTGSQLKKLVNRSIYVNSKIFNKNLVTVHKIKQTLVLDKPVYVGMCILNLSRRLIMISIIITLKLGTIVRLSYYSQIQTAFVMRSK